MTTGQPGRLDRIEAIVEANSQAQAQATEERREMREAIAQAANDLQVLQETMVQASNERQELRDVFLATMRVVSESAESQAEMLKSISEMQSEVRGLQVENRRILDRMFGDET